MANRFIILLITIGTDEPLLEEHIAKIVDREPLRRNPMMKNRISHDNSDPENRIELKSIFDQTFVLSMYWKWLPISTVTLV